jgi:hypothetical protein
MRGLRVIRSRSGGDVAAGRARQPGMKNAVGCTGDPEQKQMARCRREAIESALQFRQLSAQNTHRSGESGSGESGSRESRLVGRGTAHDRANDLDILDFFLLHRVRIVRQHHEVGQLAG